MVDIESRRRLSLLLGLLEVRKAHMIRQWAAPLSRVTHGNYTPRSPCPNPFSWEVSCIRLASKESVFA
eukprot:264648-Amphidinium_carterae.3